VDVVEGEGVLLWGLCERAVLCSMQLLLRPMAVCELETRVHSAMQDWD
jgi:hypothetical protein